MGLTLAADQEAFRCSWWFWSLNFVWLEKFWQRAKGILLQVKNNLERTGESGESKKGKWETNTNQIAPMWAISWFFNLECVREHSSTWPDDLNQTVWQAASGTTRDKSSKGTTDLQLFRDIDLRAKLAQFLQLTIDYSLESSKAITTQGITNSHSHSHTMLFCLLTTVAFFRKHRPIRCINVLTPGRLGWCGFQLQMAQLKCSVLQQTLKDIGQLRTCLW